LIVEQLSQLFGSQSEQSSSQTIGTIVLQSLLVRVPVSAVTASGPSRREMWLVLAWKSTTAQTKVEPCKGGSPKRIGNASWTEWTLPFSVRANRGSPSFDAMVIVGRTAEVDAAARIRVATGAKVGRRRGRGQVNRSMLTDPLSADRIVAVRARQRQPIRCGRDRWKNR